MLFFFLRNRLAGKKLGAERIGAGIKQTRQPNPDTFDDLQTLGLIDIWSQPVGPDQRAGGYYMER